MFAGCREEGVREECRATHWTGKCKIPLVLGLRNRINGNLRQR